MQHYPDSELRELWRILERLLATGGCPWDREQTAPDIAGHLIEEGHEWLEACRQGDEDDAIEELGDVAYLALFGLIELAKRRDEGPALALSSINAKLRRRHPHIFMDEAQDGAAPENSDAQLAVWEQVKRRERTAKGEEDRILKRLPASMGALAKSHRYQEKAARVGFDWPSLSGVTDKLAEELAELKQELAELPDHAEPPPGEGQPSARYRRSLSGRDLSGLRDELGDLLFVISNLCRWCGFDAEEVAESGNAKFLRRFAGMEDGLRAAGRDMRTADLPEMESHWLAVKAKEKAPADPEP